MTDNFDAKKGGYNKPQLSKEEWKAKKKEEKAEVFKLIEDTVEDISNSPEKFKEYLDTQARMDRYSTTNALLIFAQCPNASQLKDFNDWSSEKISIKKGEKSISILEPVDYVKADGSNGVSYNVKKMFDLSQTKGKQMAAPTENKDPRALAAAMIDSSPVNVEVVNELPYSNMGVFYNNDKQTLCVKRDIGNSVALCQSLAQELAHAQLSINSESYSRTKMGFSAVCVGYMLCRKFGIDSNSFRINSLPQDWADKNTKAIRSELTGMRSAMSEIRSRVSEQMYKQRADRSKDRER